jgi:hypothetical protein
MGPLSSLKAPCCSADACQTVCPQRPSLAVMWVLLFRRACTARSGTMLAVGGGLHC